MKSGIYKRFRLPQEDYGRIVNGKARFEEAGSSMASGRVYFYSAEEIQSARVCTEFWEGAFEREEYEIALKALNRASEYRADIARRKAKRTFSFRGIEGNEICLAEIDTKAGGEESKEVEFFTSADPAFFEALLPVCTPNSIGPVRAAMRSAIWLHSRQEDRRETKGLFGFQDEIFVFAGIQRARLNTCSTIPNISCDQWARVWRFAGA